MAPVDHTVANKYATVDTAPSEASVLLPGTPSQSAAGSHGLEPQRPARDDPVELMAYTNFGPRHQREDFVFPAGPAADDAGEFVEAVGRLRKHALAQAGAPTGAQTAMRGAHRVHLAGPALTKVTSL